MHKSENNFITEGPAPRGPAASSSAMACHGNAIPTRRVETTHSLMIANFDGVTSGTFSFIWTTCYIIPVVPICHDVQSAQNCGL